jgi:hypothetical protein
LAWRRRLAFKSVDKAPSVDTSVDAAGRSARATKEAGSDFMADFVNELLTQDTREKLEK